MDCMYFESEISKLLRLSDSLYIISITDVENMSKQFANFGNYKLTSERACVWFLSCVNNYFLLIIRYAIQFTESSFQHNQMLIREAFDTFLFVAEKIKAYSHITPGFVDIIASLIQQFGNFSVIQEVLRVFVGCIKNDVVTNASTIVGKQKFIQLLAEIATSKYAHDIRIQAVVVETLLKLFSSVQHLEQMFPDFLRTCTVVTPISNNNYNTMRQALAKLNENSTRIFSIKCSKIILDLEQVPEFEDTNSVGGVWLDFDLFHEKMSFFCTPRFLKYFANTQFAVSTSWEALSFYIKDCTAKFKFIQNTENLQISLKIQTRKFNLLKNLPPDTFHLVRIYVSRRCEKYDELVKVILPKFFKNFAHTCGKVTVALPGLLVKACEEEEELFSLVSDDDEDQTVALPDLAQTVVQTCEDETINLVSDDDEDQIMQLEESSNGKKKQIRSVKWPPNQIEIEEGTVDTPAFNSKKGATAEKIIENLHEKQATTM